MVDIINIYTTIQKFGLIRFLYAFHGCIDLIKMQ